jgi:hypothetical protein
LVGDTGVETASRYPLLKAKASAIGQQNYTVMAIRERAGRPGRNDPCPCGSGKKFKKCHLGQELDVTNSTQVDPAYRQRRLEAARIQRERQQGFGKPIVSATFKGERFIAVKNRLFHSERFKTFHDFLVRYAMMALGPAWGTTELRKAEPERHPIALWYQALCRHQRKHMSESGTVVSMPYSGGTAAFMHLAYDLYSLDHNAELQARLLTRLRHPEGFSGARYETYVAAVFIRAGFDLVFENEQDGSTTHCEFTATHRGTGKKFSVEAKRREGRRLRFGRLFNAALSKQAAHARVVFMDINTPDDERGNDRPLFLTTVRNRLRAWESTLLNGQPRPSAYVVMTNMPWEYDLDGPAARSTYLAEGFQIPDFKEGVMFPTLRAAINARKAHCEIHGLMQSIADHSEIPSTFDGELDVYSHDGAPVRIAVGSRYLFPDQNGEQRVGLVTTATVSESEGVAYCGVTLDGSDQGAIYTFPLSQAELEAYRAHRDTFFGVPSQRKTEATTPLDLYDFFHESYRHTPKDKLLEFMKTWPNQQHL